MHVPLPDIPRVNLQRGRNHETHQTREKKNRSDSACSFLCRLRFSWLDHSLRTRTSQQSTIHLLGTDRSGPLFLCMSRYFFLPGSRGHKAPRDPFMKHLRRQSRRTAFACVVWRSIRQC